MAAPSFAKTSFTIATIVVGGLVFIGAVVGYYSRDRSGIEAKYIGRNNYEINQLFPIPEDSPSTIVSLPGLSGYRDSDDIDNDGLTNEEERILGTNPYKPDTDNDGISDGKEKKLGTDPFDPADPPERPRPPYIPAAITPPPAPPKGQVKINSYSKKIRNISRRGTWLNFAEGYLGDRVEYKTEVVFNNTGNQILIVNAKDILDGALQFDANSFSASSWSMLQPRFVNNPRGQDINIEPGQHELIITFKANIIDIPSCGLAFNHITFSGTEAPRINLFAGLEILDPKIFVTNPGAGTTWIGKKKETVQWTSWNLSSRQKINIILNVNGNPLYPLATATENDGYENITVPNLNTHKASITISAIDENGGDILASGRSSTFTIQALDPTFTVLSPTEGSALTIGKAFTIRIAATLTPQTSFMALLSTDEGQTFQNISHSLKAEKTEGTYQLNITWDNTNFPESDNAILKLNRYDGNQRTYAAQVSPLKLKRI